MCVNVTLRVSDCHPQTQSLNQSPNFYLLLHSRQEDRAIILTHSASLSLTHSLTKTTHIHTNIGSLAGSLSLSILFTNGSKIAEP